jgi:hypothetical protein
MLPVVLMYLCVCLCFVCCCRDSQDPDAQLSAEVPAEGLSPPGSAALGATSRYHTERLDPHAVGGLGGVGGRGDEKDSGPSLAKITKNLSQGSKKKVLTSVLFGEKNPSVVVGDNRGTVTVYRIFDPVTITHLGPLQQYEKLKKAILQQTDPASAANLEQVDAGEEEKAY